MDAHDRDPRDPPPEEQDLWPLRQAPPAFPLSALLVVPVGMALLGGVGVLALLQLDFLPVRILIVAGPPYAVVALLVAAVLRLRVLRRPIDEQADDLYASGRSPAQRISFAVAVWLLVLWVVIAACWIAAAGSPIALLGGPLAAGALISIAANARLLYSPRVALAEVEAVRAHAPGRGPILANWVLAPVSWFAFAIPAAVLSGNGVLGF
ncbi:hypothetical protein NB037_05640 [Rathayibacter sp. ZW T2_19]|uniref:Uncharacterized protein n=1 Tax=Rathayibacter rubneri TaxID=2950106 RepID=A0A9X2E005_9MICO|nr:hypothetical protein [Rathayibacter rubneri]MCM6761899.1 hypothetical protein [Rathayibacter rubneri]